MSTLDNTPHDSSSLRGSYAYTDLKGIHYGPGCLETALPKLLQEFGAKRALIVTGKSLLEKSDVIKKVAAVLSKHDAHAGTFSEIGQHAPIAGIRAGLEAFKSSGADIIVAVGGGSPVDASKAILYYLHEESGAGPKEGWRHQIAIPTTLSAAEYTVGAGFTNEKGKKEAVSAPQLAPAAIILDAELTLATPERLWLSTGMRALDHAIENLYRPLVPPPVKHLSYAAMTDLFKYLPLSKADPSNLAIRQKLQIASWMSLWPLKLEKYSALGLSHALGHKLGAAYSIPHGITSCLTLAPTVALKAEIANDEDREWLADALPFLKVPRSEDAKADAAKLAGLIQKLVDDLGLKSTLSEYKVPKDDIPEIAGLAVGGKDNEVFPHAVKLLEGIY